jgi:hypothetical protein
MGEGYAYESCSHNWSNDGLLAGSAGLHAVCDRVLHLCKDDELDFSSGVRELNMRKFLLLATLSLTALPVIASAHGCIKGAAVGAVAGHVAGHHGVAGAAVGCAVGHHRAKEKEKEKQAAPAQATLPAPPTAH